VALGRCPTRRWPSSRARRDVHPRQLATVRSLLPARARSSGHVVPAGCTNSSTRRSSPPARSPATAVAEVDGLGECSSATARRGATRRS
jgi:hypothetical protein